MAKKLSVDLELNTTGYKASIKEATSATADYTSAVNVSNTMIKSLNAEVKKAQKEALGLAQAYHGLTEEQKNTAGGQALQRQLEDAKKYAAELYDVASDTRQEIKNMASDTAAWDAAKEGINILKSATTAYAGVVAKLTGDEKALKDVVAAITIIEGTFNAAIQIGNALQKQSAIMTGIRRVQSLAAAKAIAAETTATTGLTVAQRAFNAVAKANPYVLLATAILGVTTAIGGYILASRNASKEDDSRIKKTQELAKEQQKANQSIIDSVASVTAKYMGLRAQWKTLSTEQQKNDWIKDNQSQFSQLGLNINDAVSAEKAFDKMTDSVTTALKARAKALAAYNLLVKEYESALKEEMNGSVKSGAYYTPVQKGAEVTKEEREKLHIDLKAPISEYQKQQVNQLRLKEALERQKQTQDEINKRIEKATKLFEDNAAAAEKAAKATGDIMAPKKPETTNPTKPPKTKDNKTEDTPKTIYQEMKESLENLKGLRMNIDVEAPDAKETIDDINKRIEELEKKIHDFEVKVGITVEDPKSQLDRLEEMLKERKAELPFEVNPDDVKAAWDNIHQLEDEIKQEKIRLGLEIDPNVTIQDKIKEIIDNAQQDVEIKPKWDFSGLSDEMQKQADLVLEQFSRIQEAQQALSKIDMTGANDETTASMQEQLALLESKSAILTEQLNAMQQESDTIKKNTEKAEQENKVREQLADITSNIAGAFSSLGQAFDSKELQTAGLIGEAIAKIISGYAAANAQAGGTMGPWGWIAFTAAGLATLTATIAQVKQLSAGSYAQGGVVGGTSYYGDRLYARVNSGETILNQTQAKNALEQMDHVGAANNTTSNALQNVEFILYGEDLYGSFKNYTNLHREKL